MDRLIAATQGIGKQAILLRTGSEGAVEDLRRGVACHVGAARVFSSLADAGTARHGARSAPTTS